MPIKLHPRYRTVQEAGLELSKCMLELTIKLDLTVLECIHILLVEICHWSTLSLRKERHGNYEKKADEE